MKKSIFVVFAALLVHVLASASEGGSPRLYYIRDGERTAEFADQLFQQITGKFQNKVQSDLGWHTNSIEITPDGTIKAGVAAQVGRDGDSRFPYPTPCVLQYQGKIMDFLRYEMGGNNKEAPLYHVQMADPELTLIDSPKNSPSCEEYVRINNSEMALAYFWIDFSIGEDSLVERGRRSVYERIGQPEVDEHEQPRPPGGPLPRLYYFRGGERTSDVADQVFRRTTGKFQNKIQGDTGWHINAIEITPDGFISASVAAQVGEADIRFPCMLEFRGNITDFFRYEMERSNKRAPFYRIDMAGPELGLIDSPKNSPHCEEYVRVSNTERKKRLFFTVEFYIEEDALIERFRGAIYERVSQ